MEVVCMKLLRTLLLTAIALCVFAVAGSGAGPYWAGVKVGGVIPVDDLADVAGGGYGLGIGVGRFGLDSCRIVG